MNTERHQPVPHPSPTAKDGAPGLIAEDGAPGSGDPETAPGPVPDSVPRWSVWRAMRTGWRRPATTATNTQHLRLVKAWAVHVIAAVTTGLVILILTGWANAHFAEGDSFASAVWSVRDKCIDIIVGDIIEEYRRFPVALTLATGAVVFAIEAAFFVLAFVVMPWGARDETFRSSHRNALRQTWLQTTSITLAVLVVGSLGVAMGRANNRWYRSLEWPAWPTQPQRSANAAPGSPMTAQDSADYQAAMDQYREDVVQRNAAYRKLQQTRPWLLRYWEQLTAMVGLLGGGWLLWVLFRAVGARRHTDPVDRPPTCESCGYNLTTMPMDARCPECGEPVVRSLGPDVRPGSPWRQRRIIGRSVAWWRCWIEATHEPHRLGRALRVTMPTTEHRRFLMMHLPIAFLIGGIAFIALVITLEPPGRGNPFQGDTLTALMMAMVFGWMAVVATLGVTLLAAALVGFGFRIADKRNLLSGSMQMASYLVGFLLVAIVCAVLTGIATIRLDMWDVYQRTVRDLGLDYDFVAFILWVIPNLIWMIWYIVLLSRGTAGTRYANR